MSVSHTLELFDKLVLLILNYVSEVWGFNHGMVVESVHFAKDY